jgi:hypothetical protein
MQGLAFAQKLGRKNKACVRYLSRMRSVKPTGTVLLITIVALGLMARTSLITDSTVAVLK